MAPLLSTITLIAEVLISCIVLYIFYSGYVKNRLPYRWVVFALTYEVLFNITYMVYSALNHVRQSVDTDTALQTGLAIFHGTLSLIMFIALVVFLAVAWRRYKRGENYFRKHGHLTLIFIAFWLLAVCSGIVLYIAAYL